MDNKHSCVFSYDAFLTDNKDNAVEKTMTSHVLLDVLQEKEKCHHIFLGDVFNLDANLKV